MIQGNCGARMDERGVAMLELALCVPLVVLLFLATLEIAQLLRVTQLANVLSREAGNVAFRLCADFAEPDGMEATQSRSADCLQQMLTGPDGIQTLADSLGFEALFYPSSTLLVSLQNVM